MSFCTLVILDHLSRYKTFLLQRTTARSLSLLLFAILIIQTEYGLSFSAAAMRRARKVVASVLFSQQAKVVDTTDPDVRTAISSAALGTVVAISEDQNTMVVGAPGDTLDADGANYAPNAGAAFVYIKSSGSWIFQQKLVGVGTNGRSSGEKFGYSVAISGDTIVIGARESNYDSSGTQGPAASGAAFVFTRSAGVWSLQQRLSATGTNSRGSHDYYGSSVAISGNTIAIGAVGQRYDASGGGSITSEAGAVFMYSRSGTTWSQSQKIVATGTAGVNRDNNDNFGTSVSLDGDVLIVGAPNHRYDALGVNPVTLAGAAYIYARSGGVWSFQQKLVGAGSGTTRGSADNFGTSVSVSGNTVAIGAPNQDYDEVGGGTLTLNAGGVFIFTYDSVTWNFQQKVVGTGTKGRQSTDLFGTSVALQNDTLVVGAPSQDYDAAGNNQILDAGAVYIFLRTGSTWSTQAKYVGVGTNARVSAAKLGSCVAIYGDTFVAGAPAHVFDELSAYNFIVGSGAAFAVERSGVTWTQKNILTDMTNPAARMASANAAYGTSVSISEDQSTLVVGAPNDSTDASGGAYLSGTGAVFVYTKSGSAWVLQQKIVATGTNARIAGDGFGKSVAIYGDTLVVGAPAHGFDSSGLNFVSSAGAAFIYTRSGGVWTLQQKMVGTGTNARVASDNFGQIVSISADTVAISAPNQDYDVTGTTTQNNAGAVFIYTRSGSTWSLQQRIVLEGLPGRASSDQFGTGISLEGDVLVVGAPYHQYDDTGNGYANAPGAVGIYTRSGSTWTFQQKLALTGGNRYNYMYFGTSVSLNNGTVVVGTPGFTVDIDNGVTSSVGSAFVYVFSAGTWSFQQRLGASGLNAHNINDNFGNNVSISGDTIAVSSMNAYDAAGANVLTGAGAVWVYKRNGIIWSQSQKLVGTGTNARFANDNFGKGLAIQGDTLAIGASGNPYDSTGTRFVTGAGAAFVFAR